MISCETPLNLLIRFSEKGLYKHSYCCFSLMINWLLFFPDETRWIVALRFTLVLLVAVLSLFVSIYSFTNKVDCTGTIGVGVLGNSKIIVLPVGRIGSPHFVLFCGLCRPLN